MQNMIEYLKWRGDISFKRQPICEADYLVFAQLSYMSYDNIVKDSFVPEISVGKAAEAVLKNFEKTSGRRMISYAQNVLFLQEIINSPRFSELPICGYTDIFSVEKQEQFSAVTFLMPDNEEPGKNACVIAFRGTDSTIVGWKEDFNMAFSDAVPAQIDAVKYLSRVAEEFPMQRLYVCGHSKGGNLSVYASAFCDRDIQDRIVGVRSLDGPGFSEETIMKEGFRRILDRSETVVPSSSIVGILLEHAESFTVIRSYATTAPFQHDPFTWEISRCGYIPVETITDATKYLDETLKIWVADMTPDMRERLVNGIYEIVSSAGVEDVRDLLSQKSIFTILKSLKKLDPETVKVITEAAVLFQKAARSQLPGFLERLRDSGKEKISKGK